jgi:hypothetical protein
MGPPVKLRNEHIAEIDILAPWMQWILTRPPDVEWTRRCVKDMEEPFVSLRSAPLSQLVESRPNGSPVKPRSYTFCLEFEDGSFDRDLSDWSAVCIHITINDGQKQNVTNIFINNERSLRVDRPRLFLPDLV